ncbi:uncharacterized protein LOC9662431 isoform X2 [Selaginella moellendorffii]|uniref:uncharacterized protein LOC9662431 isoform X2 n=1 Tax=Selaginella moellendorffii TaxID=88036 RepID=UPI000D1C2B06|nr:uncharacterized protein LOC9662431 isoform X2 [Selaginella moellendorffii]|eukprot:XP_024520110.1 uncharacterized protein LOC9662431 isoform X2 [Selaginella moellendorffii]
MSRDGFPQPGTRIPPFLDAAGLFSELQDDEVGRGHGDNARNGLEIHGFPAIGQRNPLEREDYTAWPSLPGACEFREKSCSWAAESCPWQGNFGRSTSRFSLGDSQWPSLAPRQQERFSGVLERNSLATRIADEREDILGTKGPTQQSHQQLGGEDERNGGDGFSLAGRRLGIESGGSSGKGWMRLPPILMPSSHQQQQQKRCRQAAFDNSSNPSSPEEPNGFASRDAGKGAPSAPPPPPSGYLPPVYLMLNKDFVVISPLKENLLLTLALAEHRRPSTPPSFDEASSAADLFETSPEVTEVARVAAAAATATATTAVGDAKRRQVFVGRFEAFSSFVKFGLGRDAMRVATESNAGGTSTISESLSVEYFVRKFKATDVVTEMEVEYCAMNWKKVDYICNLYGQRVGVSVTRAMSYPNPEDFSPQMAYRLLYKKLFGLVRAKFFYSWNFAKSHPAQVVARHGVTDRHSFSQCVLHVWCETTTTAKLLQAQYKEVSEELDITDDVIMVLTVAEGWHARPIFYESCLVRD